MDLNLVQNDLKIRKSNSKYCLNLIPVFLYCDHFDSRCGDIVGESFLTSADSPTFMIVTMDTKFAGSRVTNKGFKLHFELEREGNTIYKTVDCNI